MSSYLYKQYVKTVAKWPLDASKSHARNLRGFLERATEQAFHVDKHSGERVLAGGTEAARVAERQLKALRRLLDNEFLRAYPHAGYRTGHMGLTLAQVREVNSEAGRQQLGIQRVDVGQKRPLWQRILFR